jgi:hypothetical protein
VPTTELFDACGRVPLWEEPLNLVDAFDGLDADGGLSVVGWKCTGTPGESGEGAGSGGKGWESRLLGI